MSKEQANLLSPTFYSKFDGLSTATPTKPKSTVKGRSTSKRVFPKESDIFTSPLTTMNTTNTFEIYEDPNVDKVLQDHSDPIKVHPEENKENEEIPIKSTSTGVPLQEIPVLSIPPYQTLQHDSFRVCYSPMFKTHVPPFQYNQMVPPSAQTRTQGSLLYRPTTVNLFKTKPDLTMNERSPSTPLKVPNFLHTSRCTSRKLFVEKKEEKRYALRPRFTKPDYVLKKKRAGPVAV
jgi:hypothetical protein